jgi:hypothetical protein
LDRELERVVFPTALRRDDCHHVPVVASSVTNATGVIAHETVEGGRDPE